ncbi:hypothetical protein V5O48_003683 [Marasmius crinis-equi]|uniref:Zn(2)-C6 fungal-type domain-containing protein n=1 Tax=Marasmius crinis-equi TaxID=585013 RepID=A0ABR3FSI1_9AGAR
MKRAHPQQSSSVTDNGSNLRPHADGTEVTCYDFPTSKRRRLPDEVTSSPTTTSVPRFGNTEPDADRDGVAYSSIMEWPLVAAWLDGGPIALGGLNGNLCSENDISIGREYDSSLEDGDGDTDPDFLVQKSSTAAPAHDPDITAVHLDLEERCTSTLTSTVEDVSIDIRNQIIKSFKSYGSFGDKQRKAGLRAEKAWIKDYGRHIVRMTSKSTEVDEDARNTPEPLRIESDRSSTSGANSTSECDRTEKYPSSRSDLPRDSNANQTALPVPQKNMAAAERMGDVEEGEVHARSPAVFSIVGLTPSQIRTIGHSFRSYNPTLINGSDEAGEEKKWIQEHAGNMGKCRTCSIEKMCILHPRHAICTRCYTMDLQCSHFDEFKYDRIACLYSVGTEVVRKIINSLPQAEGESEAEPRAASSLAYAPTRRRDRRWAKRGNVSVARRSSNAAIPENAPRPLTPSIVDSLKEATERIQDALLNQHSTPSLSIEGVSSARSASNSAIAMDDDGDVLKDAMIEAWTYMLKAKTELLNKNYQAGEHFLDSALKHCDVLFG